MPTSPDTTIASTPMTSDVLAAVQDAGEQVAAVGVGAEQVARRSAAAASWLEVLRDRVRQREDPGQRDGDDDDQRADRRPRQILMRLCGARRAAAERREVARR